jgi:hypothetical protein
MRKPHITQQYWHMVPDDEVGGWAVTNYNTDATSKLDPNLGQFVLAECRTAQIAHHIVESHNRKLDYSETETLDMFSDRVAIQVKSGSETFWLQARVNLADDNRDLVAALENLVSEASHRLLNDD